MIREEFFLTKSWSVSLQWVTNTLTHYFVKSYLSVSLTFAQLLLAIGINFSAVDISPIRVTYIVLYGHQSTIFTPLITKPRSKQRKQRDYCILQELRKIHIYFMKRNVRLVIISSIQKWYKLKCIDTSSAWKYFISKNIHVTRFSLMTEVRLCLSI